MNATPRGNPVASGVAVVGVVLALAAVGVRHSAAQPAPFHYAVPAPSTFTAQKDVVYTKSGDADVKMDVYRPTGLSKDARLPVFIFVNTHSQRSQRDHGIYTGWAAATTAKGMVAILPDATQDFAAGFDALLQYVREHAGELQVDPERVVVYAASANVVATLPRLQDTRRPSVAGAVLYYGAGSVPAFRQDLPTLFVRAGLDRPLLNQKIDSLVALSLSHNAPVQVINHSGGHHGFEMRDDTDATRDVIEQTFRFVAGVTDPRQRAALRTSLTEVRAAGAMSTEDYATATKLYAEEVSRRPDDATLRLAYAEALLGAKRYKEARAEFVKLKGKGLGYRDLGLPAAHAAIADGDPDDAIAWLQSIPKQFRPPALANDPAFASIRDRPDFKALFE